MRLVKRVQKATPPLNTDFKAKTQYVRLRATLYGTILPQMLACHADASTHSDNDSLRRFVCREIINECIGPLTRRWQPTNG